MNFYKAEFHLHKESSQITRKDLRRELRVTSQKGFRGSTLTVDCFRDEGEYWVVPRPWATVNGLKGDDKTLDISVKWPKVKLSYRHNQDEVVEKTLKKLKKDNCCRVVAETGFGKSFVCLELARLLSTNILIVVPTNEILAQFDSTAKELFNIDAGIIKGRKSETDSQVTLVTYQTLTRRLANNPDYVDKFGMLAVDEAHLAGCNSIQTVLSQINSKYRLSVSADFYRADGLKKVYELCLGEIAAIGIKNKDESLEKNLHIWDLPQYVEPSRCIDRFGDFSHIKYLNKLAESQEYSEELVNITLKLIEGGDRRVLIGLKRLVQADILYEMLGPEVSAIFSGKTKKKDLVSAASASVILYTKSDLGFDPSKFLGEELEKSLPPLNTCILGYPSKNSKQLCGRVGRENRGPTPLIILPRCNEWFSRGRVKKDIEKNWKHLEIVKNLDEIL